MKYHQDKTLKNISLQGKDGLRTKMNKIGYAFMGRDKFNTLFYRIRLNFSNRMSDVYINLSTIFYKS